jgi:excinuclease ABC subunit C
MDGKDLLAEALSLRAERKVEVSVPLRGEKREIMEMALQNAREQLARRMAENSAQRELLEGVAETFGLEQPPRRIEVYDNSHIQGTNAVGGMIVAGPDGFEKGEYRKFNIKSTELTPGDDYGMMREVLTRRFARLVKESETDDAKAKWPDLVLIDGGPGQLAIAQSVLEDLGVEDVTLVGVAKGPDRDAGREHFHMAGREPFRLELKSPVLYYLQRLRDEAHRFAIGSHRKKRAKAIGANPLDEIAGVGASRKRALLQHFGSARAVAGANLTDLESVDGVSGALARKIYDFFHPSA